MRFMVLVKANEESEAEALPDEKMFAEMGQFNEELVKAGVMLWAEGLHASSKGARVRAWRPACEARPLRRGTCGVRARGGDDESAPSRAASR